MGRKKLELGLTAIFFTIAGVFVFPDILTVVLQDYNEVVAIALATTVVSVFLLLIAKFAGGL